MVNKEHLSQYREVQLANPKQIVPSSLGGVVRSRTSLPSRNYNIGGLYKELSEGVPFWEPSTH